MYEIEKSEGRSYDQFNKIKKERMGKEIAYFYIGAWSKMARCTRRNYLKQTALWNDSLTGSRDGKQKGSISLSSAKWES